MLLHLLKISVQKSKVFPNLLGKYQVNNGIKLVLMLNLERIVD